MSSAPTVMVSSTFYDLRQIRADLARFIADELGYIPLLSELASFPVDPDLDIVENCRARVEQNADILVFQVVYLPYPPRVEFSPHRLGSIAAWCKKKQRVAIVLNRNGEVLIFKDQKLQFAKRRGAWRYYAHDSVVRRLGVGNKSLRRAVYETCLDVSFARTGGCVGVLSAKRSSRLEEVLSKRDLIARGQQIRTKLLGSAIKKPFHQLDRRLRQELLSMDGATVLNHKGEVLTAGSIVRVPSGSTGGGRKAAAMQLSKLGLAIKISADGPITGFRNRGPIFFL